MKGRIAVVLVRGHHQAGLPIRGVVHEFDADEVKDAVNKLMQAEGQGSLVLDLGNEEYAIIPTRSINFVKIERVNDEPNT